MIESSSSSDDDSVLLPVIDHSTPLRRHSDTSSSESENVDSVVSDNGSSVLGPRRSSRQRRSPDRFGDPLSYNSSNALPGENEVTQSYLPGYPRGTYSHR